MEAVAFNSHWQQMDRNSFSLLTSSRSDIRAYLQQTCRLSECSGNPWPTLLLITLVLPSTTGQRLLADNFYSNLFLHRCPRKHAQQAFSRPSPRWPFCYVGISFHASASFLTVSQGTLMNRSLYKVTTIIYHHCTQCASHSNSFYQRATKSTVKSVLPMK